MTNETIIWEIKGKKKKALIDLMLNYGGKNE